MKLTKDRAKGPRANQTISSDQKRPERGEQQVGRGQAADEQLVHAMDMAGRSLHLDHEGQHHGITGATENAKDQHDRRFDKTDRRPLSTVRKAPGVCGIATVVVVHREYMFTCVVKVQSNSGDKYLF